ncbi:MAG: S8 family serine peptidase [Caldilineaceae bacterium]|nr:S8 family serine peptidase [Caldilineaceae bacterium]
MNWLQKTTFSALLAFALLTVTGMAAYADEFTCTGALGGVTVENLRVPQGATCTLTGTRVEGNIKVEREATLNAAGVRVKGNVQAENHLAVNVGSGSTVGGSVQVKQGGGAQVLDTRVTGDIQYDSNSQALEASRNTVGGNIQVMKNRRGVTITGNVIDGNLQCKENDPAPIGSGNVVKGSAEDQCAQLTGGDGDGGGGDGGGDDGGGDDGGGDDGCDDDDNVVRRADDDDDDDCIFVPRQVVIKLNADSGAAIEDINGNYGTSTLQMLLGSGGIYLLQTPSNTTVEALVRRMQSDSRLAYAEPNFYGEAPEGGGRGKWAWAGSTPSPTGSQYAATMLRLDEAHAISRGANMVVAVLDTGVQLDHPLLADRWTEARYDFVDDDPIPDEAFALLDRNGDGIVDESAGHGTHVAAIVTLVAPEARIMPVRVLDARGRGNVFLITEAVRFAAENGAHVINLSLGTTRPSQLLGETIEVIVNEHNVSVVAAAGNLNTNEQQYPAAGNGVLAVTAINQNQRRASFANYGPWVDLAAPGVDIYSAFPVNGYAFWSGTSMATPFVAGQAALLRSLDRTLTAEGIESTILSTAAPLSDGLGAGMLNLVGSLEVVAVNMNDDDIGADDGSSPTVLTVQAYLPFVHR